MAQCNENNVNKMMEFLDAPYEEEIVAMDCNDFCEELAQLAEQVAAGAKIEELLPNLEQHMQYWKDCREEFDALVAVIKAESGDLPAELDNLVNQDE